MIKLFFLAICISWTCMAMPRYGDDGGYQGYASYKPMTGLNALLMNTGLRQRKDIPTREQSKYGLKNKEKPEAVSKETSSEEYSVPKSYEVLRQTPKYTRGQSNNLLLESPASPYGHAAAYGNSNGGFKIADVYSNEYSGSSYEEHDDYANHPQPYEFGYQVKDDYGNEQFKTEISDGDGKVKGSYGYVDEHGLYRKVDYVADKSGFHAKVKTNEPGTANQDPADVHIDSTEEEKYR